MKSELINKIKQSNDSCNLLEEAGATLQGRTANLESVAVLFKGGLTFHKNYTEARLSLLK